MEIVEEKNSSSFKIILILAPLVWLIKPEHTEKIFNFLDMCYMKKDIMEKYGGRKEHVLCLDYKY